MTRHAAVFFLGSWRSRPVCGLRTGQPVPALSLEVLWLMGDLELGPHGL